MHRRAVVHALGAAVAAAVLAACGASEAASPDVPSTVGGVGVLPGELPAGASSVPTSAADEAATTVASATTVAASAPDADERSVPPPSSVPVGDPASPVGRLVDGNRVLVIGDSILASISDRYGGQLCERLVPRGWEVEVDAEVGRFVEFGRQVLDRRRDEDWDAAVVMLGNNHRGDPAAFGRELGLLLDELRPLPVLLLTVTRFEPAQDGVNYVLVGAANQRDDVRVLDWAARTSADVDDAEELLTGDGLHLTTEGQDALADLISRGLGRAPAGSQGACLRSSFRDDSGGSLPDASDASDASDPPSARDAGADGGGSDGASGARSGGGDRPGPSVTDGG